MKRLLFIWKPAVARLFWLVYYFAFFFKRKNNTVPVDWDTYTWSFVTIIKKRP